jgi:hypothetical protein
MITRWTMAVQVGAFVCALAISAEAAAATIYGFIQENNQPVRRREVVLNCGGKEAARAVTDDRGNYRITTGRTGRCTLVVNSVSSGVVLYTEPTQYNFEIRGAQLIRR